MSTNGSGFIGSALRLLLAAATPDLTMATYRAASALGASGASLPHALLARPSDKE